MNQLKPSLLLPVILLLLPLLLFINITATYTTKVIIIITISIITMSLQPRPNSGSTEDSCDLTYLWQTPGTYLAMVRFLSSVSSHVNY